jgi:hypothetical protein
MHSMNVQEVGAAEAANSNPLATAASSGTGCLACRRKASSPRIDGVCTCSTRLFSNHLTQTAKIGVEIAGELGGGAHSSSCSSSSSNYEYDYGTPTSSSALHHKLDQLYAPSSPVRTSREGRRGRGRGGGTKQKKVDVCLNDVKKSYGSSNSKSSSDDSLSMKKPAAIPLGSVKLPPKHGDSSMGSETAFSDSSVQHLLGFHLKRREPFRAQSLSTTAMKASTALTTVASKSDSRRTASATAPAAAYHPTTARECPPAKSASLQPTSSYSTAGNQVEYYRQSQQQQPDELHDWLKTRHQPLHYFASESAAKPSDRLVMSRYQHLRQLLNEFSQKEDQVTEELLELEEDTYPSAVAQSMPSAPNSKRLAGADEAVYLAASAPSLPTKSVSLQILSPTSSSIEPRNPYLHLVLDELYMEDENNRRGYPGYHYHHPSSLAQPPPLHQWQSEQLSPTAPIMMRRPRSTYTTTLGVSFPTRSQRSQSFAVTMKSNHHHHHQPSYLPDSIHSESKRRRDRIWHKYLRLIESRSGRDPGTTISSSESGSSMSGRLFFLEPSLDGYLKKKKTSSKSRSSKADASETGCSSTGNRESFILDKLDQLEWMYDLEQVNDHDDYMDEARPELDY